MDRDDGGWFLSTVPRKSRYSTGSGAVACTVTIPIGIGPESILNCDQQAILVAALFVIMLYSVEDACLDVF